MRNIGKVAWSLAMGTLFLSLSLGLLGHGVSVYAEGNVILVAPDGTDQPGCGQTPACRTIKYAVESQATAGDIIQVAAGVYTDSVLVTTSSLKIYGAGVDQSIIDGENKPASLIIFGPGLTASTVLSGFTIQNGQPNADGGGLYLFQSSPTLQYLTIQSNTTGGRGGGLFIEGGSPLITASRIQHNAAISGGGLYLVGDSAPLLQDSTICGNSAAQVDNAGTGLVAAGGNWWGVNNLQIDVDYTGAVTATPPISLNLTLDPADDEDWLVGVGGRLTVTMRGGGYNAWAGERIVLDANQAIFPGGISTTEVLLDQGLAALTITPTLTTTIVIAAYHDCDLTQPVGAKNLRLDDLDVFVYLPLVTGGVSANACPTTSAAQYQTIPFVGAAIDHPDYLHGDLNLARRGYNPVSGVPLTLVDYPGGTDSNAPKLRGLFADSRTPTFNQAYQVNDWNWNCGTDGCPGPPLSSWPTTLIGMVTTPGENVYIPDRAPTIFTQGGQNYKTLVLYAEERRLTLTYVREDSVANGYSVHLENFCVDPNLLALYRAQVDQNGFRLGNSLPGLKQDQVIGVALGELRATVRDRGAFLDPRSRKDWW